MQLKRHNSRWPYSIGLLIAYILTHLVSLRSLPMIGDEGVHIWWAERLVQGDILRSLNVGKPWEPILIAPGILLGMDLLAWSRLVHVLVGALAVMLLVEIGRHLFSLRAGWLAGLVYIVLPYATFFSRAALTEILLTTAGLIVIWMTLKAVSYQTDVWILSAGIAMILSFSSKMPIGLFWSIVPLVLLIFDVGSSRKTLWHIRGLTALYAPLAITLLAVASVALFRASRSLSPGFGLGLTSAQSGGVFGPDLGERMLRNTHLAIKWLSSYFTWPLFIFALTSLFISLGFGSAAHRSVAFLVLAGIFPFLLVAELWHSDYLFFISPLLCLLSGDLCTRLLASIQRYFRNNYKFASSALLVGCLILPALIKSMRIQYVPDQANLPSEDRQMYIEGCPAGYGYTEASTWLIAHPPSLVVNYYIADYAQTKAYLPVAPPFLLKQVHVVDGVSQSAEQRLNRLAQIAQDYNSYILILCDENHDSIPEWLRANGLLCEQMVSFPRPGAETRVTLYQIAVNGP